MDEKKLRLGGMALANGVLVHGPTSWACAVRTTTGTLKVASGTKPKIAVSSDLPLLRGPARLLEAVLVLPRVRRELPEARFAFERRNVRRGDGCRRRRVARDPAVRTPLAGGAGARSAA